MQKQTIKISILIEKWSLYTFDNITSLIKWALDHSHNPGLLVKG